MSLNLDIPIAIGYLSTSVPGPKIPKGGAGGGAKNFKGKKLLGQQRVGNHRFDQYGKPEWGLND